MKLKYCVISLPNSQPHRIFWVISSLFSFLLQHLEPTVQLQRRYVFDDAATSYRPEECWIFVIRTISSRLLEVKAPLCEL